MPTRRADQEAAVAKTVAGFGEGLGELLDADGKRLAGHGPTLFAGLSKHVDLRLVGRLELGSGAVALRYEPRR